MEDLIRQFENDLKNYLEITFNFSNEQEPIKKLDDIEKAAGQYVDNYLLKTDLIAADVALPVQHILDEFIKAKFK